MLFIKNISLDIIINHKHRSIGDLDEIRLTSTKFNILINSCTIKPITSINFVVTILIATALWYLV
jgi:hypothetical protein